MKSNNKKFYSLEERILYYEKRIEHASKRLDALKSELATKGSSTGKTPTVPDDEIKALAELIKVAFAEYKKAP